MRKFLLKYMWFLTALAIFLCYALLFKTAEVSGRSMEPTCYHQDLLLMLKSDKPSHGNIVAIYSEKLNELLCKRVVGVAGDHIVINKNGLFVNDELVEEPFVSQADWFEVSQEVDLVVPVNEVFVMGDNRTASRDSRLVGCLPTSDIRGVVVCNVTRLCGITRETLVAAVTMLITGSLVVELWKKSRNRHKGAVL